jgi:serine protease
MKMNTAYLVIKYQDNVEFSKADPSLPLPESAQQSWKKLASDLPGKLTIRRQFWRVGDEKIAALVALATARDRREGGYETRPTQQPYVPPRLQNFLWVTYSDDNKSDAEVVSIAAKLAEEFSRWRSVQYAYVRVADRPASVAPPRVTASRPPPAATFLQPAPKGIDAVSVWKLPGGDGAGQTLLDIEWGWFFQHKALLNPVGQPRAKLSPSSGGTMGPAETWAHGTAVLGLICARDTGGGAIGIAPGVANVHATSVWAQEDVPSTAEQVLQAAAQRVHASLTDELEHTHASSPTVALNTVILIEMQSRLIGQSHWFPVEVYSDTFAVIELLTRAGLTVVEAAGNGLDSDAAPGQFGASPPPAVDLDLLENFIRPTAGLPLNIRSLNPARQQASPGSQSQIPLAAFSDSGAIIVAAGVRNADGVPGWSRQFNSNFGRRVNCFAQGEDVKTLTYDPNNPDARFSGFGGTSAASAIIAGAALCVQGFAQSSARALLRALQMRELLGNNTSGTKAVTPGVSKIGVMPNLNHTKAQVQQLSSAGQLEAINATPGPT